MKKALTTICCLFGLFSMLSCRNLDEDPSVSERIAAADNPNRMVLCMTSDPTTSIGINFEVSEDIEAFVEYRIRGSGDFIRQNTTRKTTTVGSTLVFHRQTVVEGLQPGTEYEYRLIGTEIGETSLFRTAQEDQTEVTFMVLTDPQGSDALDYSTYANNILHVLDETSKNVDFALFSGDMVNDDSSRSQWNLFFQYSSVFWLTMPIAATTGNHETGSFTDSQIENIEFSGYFHFPETGPRYEPFDVGEGDLRPSEFDAGKTYSFDVGAAHFVAVDSEIFRGYDGISGEVDPENLDRFTSWLEADLSANPDQWIILFLHRGPYSLHYDSVNVRNFLVPILDKYGVDLVLSGHDHRYSRTVYSEGSFVGFTQSAPSCRGQTHLLTGQEDSRNLQDYSSSLGVTYVVGNSAGVKLDVSITSAASSLIGASLCRSISMAWTIPRPCASG